MTNVKKPVKFANVAVKDREQHIKASCYVAEKTQVKRKYNEDELATFKDGFADLKIEVIEIDKQIDEKTEEIIKPLKDKIKSLETTAEEILTKFQKGYEVVELQVFGFPDYERRMMDFYNEDGTWIFERSLKEEEMQLKKSFVNPNQDSNESGNVTKTA